MSRTSLPSAPEISFYGELDPFAGGVSSHLADLPRLIRELSISLLVKDIVILSPGTLLEHALTLLACEALAPFVRSGRLTTTTSSSVARPSALIDARIAEYIEELGPERRRKVERARRVELAEVSDRWHALLPPTWSLVRDVSAQIAGFASSVLESCLQERAPSRATTQLRHMLEEGLGAGIRLDRNIILAQVASLRANALPPELARLSFMVQSTFYAFGVGSHRNCTLYPGAFAKLAHRLGGKVGGLEFPAVDWTCHPSHVSQRLATLGCDLDRLLALPAEELASISGSTQWQLVRALLPWTRR